LDVTVSGVLPKTASPEAHADAFVEHTFVFESQIKPAEHVPCPDPVHVV
jgi:hypothetical protein